MNNYINTLLDKYYLNEDEQINLLFYIINLFDFKENNKNNQEQLIINKNIINQIKNKIDFIRNTISKFKENDFKNDLIKIILKNYNKCEKFYNYIYSNCNNYLYNVPFNFIY